MLWTSQILYHSSQVIYSHSLPTLCCKSVNRMILFFQRVLESDIRIGSYSYDAKKEEWCEVSLKVSAAEMCLVMRADLTSWTMEFLAIVSLLYVLGSLKS